MASVKVAVRVRPFNSRETNLKSTSVVHMENQSVTLLPTPSKATDSGSRPHAFTFDYAYYSHDPLSPNFVNQETVFDNLGLDVVSNAFKGYNVCVFAYGQTGSGKTHTMMGSEPDPGLIPRICSELFDRMKDDELNTSYRTEVSYLEIYNEKVKDLLGEEKKGGHNLKVREDPRSGPYVQNLSKHLVLDYDAIISLMSKGNSERTTASTNMNNTSSRSHAIFTITFTQASVLNNGLPRETISKVHLVDLAGSERADATGATGKRLKEGAHINKSLVTLGSVISALADASNSHQANKKVFVPYRDSVLTWLLRDSLGGNSQTIMIATISPADVNHGETLSTLRYANRAKNIINKPTVNEDPNVKLIRELREEIERLKESLIVTTPDPLVATEIAVKEARERTLTEAWTEKWREAANILQEQKALGLKRTGLGVVLDSEKPHLIGIVEDVLSTGIILYHLKEGATIIGSEDRRDSDIVLRGPDILPRHCIIHLTGGLATLTPEPGALCLVNAVRVSSGPVKLSQGCVLVLGRTNMFRYNDPSEVESLRKNMSSRQNEYNNNNNNNHSGSGDYHYASNQSLLSESLSDLRTSRCGELKLLSSSSSSTSSSTNSNVDEDEEALKSEGIPSSKLLLPIDSCSSTLSLSSGGCLEESSINTAVLAPGGSRSSSTATPLASPLKEDRLYSAILEQKEVIMKCLENENVDVTGLNEEILALQEMQGQYEKQEFERMRRLWALSKGGQATSPPSANYGGPDGSTTMEVEERLAILVEQEVDRRLFQEKILKAESDYHEREALRSSCEREMNALRRQREREIYILKRKLYESHVAVFSGLPGSLRSQQQVNGGGPGGNPPSSEEAFPVLVTIPSYRIVGGSSTDAHVEYEVKLCHSAPLLLSAPNPPPQDINSSLILRRRYKTFRDLHRNMMLRYGEHLEGGLSFPPRRFIGSSLSESLSNERQRALQIYMNRLLQTIYHQVPSSPLLLQVKDPLKALTALSPFFKKAEEET